MVISVYSRGRVLCKWFINTCDVLVGASRTANISEAAGPDRAARCCYVRSLRETACDFKNSSAINFVINNKLIMMDVVPVGQC